MTLPLERCEVCVRPKARPYPAHDPRAKHGADRDVCFRDSMGEVQATLLCYRRGYERAAKAEAELKSIREAASRAPETAEAVAESAVHHAIATDNGRCPYNGCHLCKEVAAALQREREIAAVRMACALGPISAAVGLAHRYGGIEGDHHRAWVIDQMVRALTGADYAQWVKEQRAGTEGPDTYDWSEGIAP